MQTDIIARASYLKVICRNFSLSFELANVTDSYFSGFYATYRHKSRDSSDDDDDDDAFRSCLGGNPAFM